ncbi:hypothetical protein FRC10_001965 [Ceratobasidium sp. 414]|nr:hypothetical protein FRC10_001965 [Ceratobasidium sp. 414]
MLFQDFKTRGLLSVAFLVTGSSAATNDGITLAIGPSCGTLAISPSCGKLTTTGSTADANAGLLDIAKYRTVVNPPTFFPLRMTKLERDAQVSFGDSYTCAGKNDGSPVPPAVVVPPNPLAGNRATNGPVWIENIANDVGVTFKNYTQSNLFLGQNNALDPSTTLYTVYFGINDNIAAAKSGNTAGLTQAAQTIFNEIQMLASPPTSGRHFLIADSYALGKHNTAGDTFKKRTSAAYGTACLGPRQGTNLSATRALAHVV